MKNNNLPLTIILKRTQNGYQFEALQELLPNKDKNKKAKPGRKPAIKGAPNRLIKQIGLSNEQIVHHNLPTPEQQPIPQFQEEIQDNPPIYQQLQQQQEVSCEIERQTELPKSPANWFDKNKIHQLQKRQMKEFFSNYENKKPELYVKYRNFIIEAYEKNPKRYLTKIACRKILRGDANTIMRIHSFLEKQGLINFCVNYDGNFTFKSNSLTKPFEQTIQPQTTLRTLPQTDQLTSEKQIDTDNMTLTVINKNFSRTYRACCNECKLICGIVWFGNVTEQESANQKNLCFECWSKKSQSEKQEYEKVDIVKKMQAHGREGKNFAKNAWNIQQNIKLLEFMSNNGSNKSWKRLLTQFGGKRTIEDIVLQFLQFPISNFQVGKRKKQFSRFSAQTEQFQVGFHAQDYKNILKEFYQQSQYNKKKNKDLQKINEDKKDRENKENQQFLSLKEMLNLAMSKINVQIQNLKAQQQLIQTKTVNYSCLFSYGKSKISGCEEEEMGKETNDIDNRSRSLKNFEEKKNSSSQFLDDIECDGNDLEDL